MKEKDIAISMISSASRMSRSIFSGPRSSFESKRPGSRSARVSIAEPTVPRPGSAPCRHPITDEGATDSDVPRIVGYSQPFLTHNGSATPQKARLSSSRPNQRKRAPLLERLVSELDADEEHTTADESDACLTSHQDIPERPSSNADRLQGGSSSKPAPPIAQGQPQVSRTVHESSLELKKNSPSSSQNSDKPALPVASPTLEKDNTKPLLEKLARPGPPKRDISRNSVQFITNENPAKRPSPEIENNNKLDKKQSNASSKRVEKPRILVAEDNKINQEVIMRMLKMEKVKDVKLAVDGLEAVNIIKEDAAFDLILMDIQMPNMDGIEATKQIRQIGFEQPIVALSAFADDSNKENCLKSGMAAFLAKPLKRPALKQLLKQYANGTVGKDKED